MADTSFNRMAAGELRACAELLKLQDANPFRVAAYVHAAETLEGLAVDARDILRREGAPGLQELPHIGAGLAAAVSELAHTGRLTRLERLRGAADPETVFRSVPGIGATLAATLHDTLHVDTLEALEVAAHDGRLEAVPGVGPRRTAAIRAGLAALLSRKGGHPRSSRLTPSVGTLLAVDREYRTRASADGLPKIAPRRFNPAHAAWLPILHTDRDGWHFTALYSNTAKAHQLGRTRDWVVVYFHTADHQEGQQTVVTETHGPLRGRRVVRGREAECVALYRDLKASHPAPRPASDPPAEPP